MHIYLWAVVGILAGTSIVCEAGAAVAAGPDNSTPRVISRGEAAGTYQAFPDMCRLADGRIGCVFYAGYGHVSLPKEGEWARGGRVCLVESGDEGKTWSTPRVVVDTAEDDRDPHIAALRDGRLVCSFFTRWVRGGKTGYQTCLVTSRDGGKSWDATPRVLAEEWVCSAPVRELPGGLLILGVYRGEGGTAYGGIMRSEDGGRTWGEPIPIGKGSGVRLDAETDFVLLRDGTLYAALRGDGKVNMHYATSGDQGKTWSKVADLGFPGHCPHFTRLGTGEILLAHRLPRTALHVSRDEGKSWQGPYEIDQTIGAYPSTLELKDGSVLVVYYEEGKGSGVRARRLRVGERGVEFLPLEATGSSRR